MTWIEYTYVGFEDHDDPTKYENQTRQMGKYTATVWVLHLRVPPVLVKRTLETIEDVATARRITLTYEYHYDEDDEQLTVYYRAMSASSALLMGQALAWQVNHQKYAITPAGDHDVFLARINGEEENDPDG